MLVTEFCQKQYDGFPLPFYESLPEVCLEGCGYPMEMSPSLTQLHCSNPRCIAKVTRRLYAMMQFLGVKDFGEARIRGFLEAWGIDNPLYIFAYEPSDGSLSPDMSQELSEKIYNQVQAKKSMTLAEYVRLANIPNVQTSASHIFGEFDDIEEAYEQIEKEGVEYIQSKLDISTEDVSARALLVYKSLMLFKQDLIDAIRFIDLIKVNTEESISLKAVVSDEVGGGFGTKAEFYALCNSINPRVHIEFLGAVTKSIDHLIWAGADGSPARYTNKVSKVEKMNLGVSERIAAGKPKAGDHIIPIVTAQQYIDMLKEL